MQYDNIIDSITEAQAKGFIEWLLLKYSYHLILADAHDLTSRDTDKIKMVMTYKTDDENCYPSAPIIIRDGDDFIGYVLWTCYNTDYAYRDILKQMFSGHDIYLYWDIKQPIISKNVSFSTLFVEYDLQDLCKQKV